MRKNVVPLKAPDKFAEVGIAWTREPQSERERVLREAFLTYEASCGPNGLVSILLLALVTRRQRSIGTDLQNAADHAEILLGIKLRNHQMDVLETVRSHVSEQGPLWER